MGGQSLGKPEPVIGQDWEGYDSRILQVKVVSSMTASKGRFGRFSTVVMVGNGRGLAGIGKAKSTNLRNALRIAKKRATQRFEYYEIRESRTCESFVVVNWQGSQLTGVLSLLGKSGWEV